MNKQECEIEEKYSKYEIARILGARALQLSMNAPLLLKIDKGELERIKYDPLKIAEIELRAGILPITVKRPLPQRMDIEEQEEDSKRETKEDLEEKKQEKKIEQEEIKEEMDIEPEEELEEKGESEEETAKKEIVKEGEGVVIEEEEIVREVF